MDDPYLDPETGLLKNKMNIKDEQVLLRAEMEMTTVSLAKLAANPLKGNYDLQHFCDFHAAIFGNIYEWAGQLRTVNIFKQEEKLGYLSVEYTDCKEIKVSLQNILNEMGERQWNKMSVLKQAEKLSHDMTRLWKVHAFREGNTRTVVTFVCQFAESRGMALDRELFAKNAAYTRTALVAASAFFKDGTDFSKTEYLYKIVLDSLQRGRAKQASKSISRIVPER